MFLNLFGRLPWIIMEFLARKEKGLDFYYANRAACCLDAIVSDGAFSAGHASWCDSTNNRFLFLPLRMQLLLLIKLIF